jgi:hypothetical protein
MSDNTENAAQKRLGFDTKTEMTGHGFRTMARTILDEILHVRPEHQLLMPSATRLAEQKPHNALNGTPKDDAGVGRLSGSAQSG